MMTMKQDCYEHFTDIKHQHLRTPNWIYSPFDHQWRRIQQNAWNLLLLLVRTRMEIRLFHDNILHPYGHPGTIEDANEYNILLNREAGLKKTMQPIANQYCMKFKGYSLN